MHEFKLKNSFLLGFNYNFIIALFALFIAVLIHELGHYMAALYYGLSPSFGIGFNAVYVKTNFLDSRSSEIISHMGPILNLIAASFISIFLFIREHTRRMDDDICIVLLIMQITNMLVALFSLILFPFSGLL